MIVLMEKWTRKAMQTDCWKLDRVSSERRPKEGESVRRDCSGGGKALDIWSRYGGAGSGRGLEVGRPEDTNLG